MGDHAVTTPSRSLPPRGIGDILHGQAGFWLCQHQPVCPQGTGRRGGTTLVGTEQLPRIQKRSRTPCPPSTQGSREGSAWRPPGCSSRHLGKRRRMAPRGRTHGCTGWVTACMARFLLGVTVVPLTIWQHSWVRSMFTENLLWNRSCPTGWRTNHTPSLPSRSSVYRGTRSQNALPSKGVHGAPQ